MLRTVTQVGEGNECGLVMEGYKDWQEGDEIVCYETRLVKRSLEEAAATQAVSIDEDF